MASCNHHYWTILIAYFTIFGYLVTLSWAVLSDNRSHSVNISNHTCYSCAARIKNVVESGNNKASPDKSNINYDMYVNLRGSSTQTSTGLKYLENNHRNQTDFIQSGVNFGNQTKKQSSNSNNSGMDGCRLENKHDNITDERDDQQTTTDYQVSDQPIVYSDIATVYSFDRRINNNTTSLEMKAVIKPRRRHSFTSGILSEAQSNEYIEIIKAIKWALNFVALLMTLTSVIVFARTNNQSSTTTFILALNILGCLAAVLAIAGYTLNFVNGRSSMTFLIFTLYLNRFTGAVCRRIVYLLNMMMSGQRLTVIALPFLSRTTFRKSINLAIISVVVVITFAGHVYIPLSVTIEDMGGGQFRFGPSTLCRNNNNAFDMIKSAAKCVFAFIPLAASLLANTLLLVYLKKHTKKTENLCALSKTDGQNRQVTLIVLVSSVSFTLLSLPANMHNLTASYTSGYGLYKREHYLFLVVNEALLGLLTLGDITNFLSYAFLSSSFRNQFNTALKSKPTRFLGAQLPRTAEGHDTSNSSSCVVTMTTRKY